MCNGFKYLRFFRFFEGPRLKSGTAKTVLAVLLGPALEILKIYNSSDNDTEILYVNITYKSYEIKFQ